MPVAVVRTARRVSAKSVLMPIAPGVPAIPYSPFSMFRANDASPSGLIARVFAEAATAMERALGKAIGLVWVKAWDRI